MLPALFAALKSTALGMSAIDGAVIALVVAIGIAGVAIILITSKKN